jgi:hypothetical protein
MVIFLLLENKERDYPGNDVPNPFHQVTETCPSTIHGTVFKWRQPQRLPVIMARYYELFSKYLMDK